MARAAGEQTQKPTKFAGMECIKHRTALHAWGIAAYNSGVGALSTQHAFKRTVQSSVLQGAD